MISYGKLTRCMLWNLLQLDLFYSSTLDLFNTQANTDAVQMSTPIPVCINCRTCINFNCNQNTMFKIFILLTSQTTKNIGHVNRYQNNPQTPRILSGPLVLKFLDLSLACVNLHSDSGTCKKNN